MRDLALEAYFARWQYQHLPIAIIANTAGPVSHWLRPPGFRRWTGCDGSGARRLWSKSPMHQLTRVRGFLLAFALDVVPASSAFGWS